MDGGHAKVIPTVNHVAVNVALVFTNPYHLATAANVDVNVVVIVRKNLIILFCFQLIQIQEQNVVNVKAAFLQQQESLKKMANLKQWPHFK